MNTNSVKNWSAICTSVSRHLVHLKCIDYSHLNLCVKDHQQLKDLREIIYTTCREYDKATPFSQSYLTLP